MFEDSAKGTKAIRELVRTLTYVGDELKRNMLMKTISKKFNLREKLIESELNSALDQKKKSRTNISNPVQKEIRISENPAGINIYMGENPYEKEIIRLLYGGKEEVIEYILEKIGAENFGNPKYKNLVEIVTDGFNEHKISPAYLVEKIENEELRDFIFKLSLADETISKKWDELSYNGKIEKDTFEHAEETIRSFLIYEIERQIKSNNQLISESNDERLFIEFLKRNRELQDEKKNLLNSKTR